MERPKYLINHNNCRDTQASNVLLASFNTKNSSLLQAKLSKQTVIESIDTIINLIDNTLLSEQAEVLHLIRIIGQWILTQEVDINLIVNSAGINFLHLAASVGDTELIGNLLHKGMAKNAHDVEGKTPLCYAIENGQLKAIELLLEIPGQAHLSQNDTISLINGIVILINRGNLGVRQIISLVSSFVLKHGNDITSVSNEEGITYLHLAALIGDIALIESFIIKGIDANAHTIEGKTALYYAIQNAQLEAVEFLIKLQPYTKNMDGIILLDAILTLIDQIREEDIKDKIIPKIVRQIGFFLLNRVQNISNIFNDTQTTLLHCAAIVGDTELIAHLQARGMNIQNCNLEKHNPLHYAIRYGQLQTVQFLLPQTFPTTLYQEDILKLQEAELYLYDSVNTRDRQRQIEINALGALPETTLATLEAFLLGKYSQGLVREKPMPIIPFSFFASTKAILHIPSHLPNYLNNSNR